MDLKKYIEDVKDFPKKGIIFKDISPLLADAEAFNETIKKMSSFAIEADVIAGIDARGFIFGAALAFLLKKPFVMIRKKDKLPGKVIKKEYQLEYGINVLEIKKNLIKENQKVVIVDDILATGGTLEAAAKLIEMQNAVVIKLIVLLELEKLQGRKNLNYKIDAILKA